MVPPLLHFELANVCVTKLRRHPVQHEAFQAAFALGTQMEMTIVDVDHDETISLAERTGLTAYDAS